MYRPDSTHTSDATVRLTLMILGRVSSSDEEALVIRGKPSNKRVKAPANILALLQRRRIGSLPRGRAAVSRIGSGSLRKRRIARGSTSFSTTRLIILLFQDTKQRVGCTSFSSSLSGAQSLLNSLSAPRFDILKSDIFHQRRRRGCCRFQGIATCTPLTSCRSARMGRITVTHPPTPTHAIDCSQHVGLKCSPSLVSGCNLVGRGVCS